jgi:hypothetical protein
LKEMLCGVREVVEENSFDMGAIKIREVKVT